MKLKKEIRHLQNLTAITALLSEKQVTSVLLLMDPALLEQNRNLPIEQALLAARVDCIVQPTQPTAAGVQALKKAYQEAGAGATIALGGGTTMDCAKALRAGMKGRHLFIALPSTAGAGSEYLPQTWIEGKAVPGARAADAVLADVSYTRTLPAEDMVRAAMIALTHAVSAFLAPIGTNTMRDKALKAVQLIAQNLRRVAENAEDADARAALLLGSCMAGEAFSRQRSGYVPAVARVLSNAYGFAYSEVCAALLPDYLAGCANMKSLARLSRAVDASPVDGDDMIAKEALLTWLQTLCEEFSLPQIFPDILRRDVYHLAADAHTLFPDPLPRSMKQQLLEQAIASLMGEQAEQSSDAGELIAAQKAYFAQGRTLPLTFRLDALRRLKDAILAHEADIAAALQADLGKSASESYMCETGMVIAELNWMLRHTAQHVRRHYVPTPLHEFSAVSFTVNNPLGTVLIMSPWNYPFLLTLAPLAGAIAAGNCCIVKPSAYAPATSRLIAGLCRECFVPEHVAVVEGGRKENQALLEQTFDKIFFTGSPAVGREVLRKAAEHLTPVTLELGGKSPVVIDHTAHLALAARRIAFGKLLNAGQTCVAPDYVLIEASVMPDFIEELKKAFTAMAGENALINSDYVHMIHQRHYDRVMGLMEPEKIVFGGQGDPETLRIQPTILCPATAESPAMQEEIFGPVLPVLPVRDMDEAARLINSRPHPLALYVFSQDRSVQKRFLEAVPYGGGCINDVVIHLATSRMGFGGVGGSGMGSYHGKHSLETFSHRKSIVKKHVWLDLPMRYAPYNKTRDKLIRFFLR